MKKATSVIFGAIMIFSSHVLAKDVFRCEIYDDSFIELSKGSPNTLWKDQTEYSAEIGFFDTSLNGWVKFNIDSLMQTSEKGVYRMNGEHPQVESVYLKFYSRLTVVLHNGKVYEDIIDLCHYFEK